MKYIVSSCVVMSALFCAGCYNDQDLHSVKEREMTVGLVQKEISRGMSGADVASSLGSPNIVTRDKSGLESWVYDKIATEVSRSETRGGIWFILAGLDKSSSAKASTQKTLTVVIKFDNEQKVDSVSYHSSKF